MGESLVVELTDLPKAFFFPIGPGDLELAVVRAVTGRLLILLPTNTIWWDVQNSNLRIQVSWLYEIRFTFGRMSEIEGFAKVTNIITL